MSVNNGYLIPPNPSPETNRCVRVYVPNDPLYMAALLGTLTYLGQWTAWERDAEHRGTLAANSWKNANDLTLDGLSIPCANNPITDEEMTQILEQLERIESQLAELNDMNITVTQTAGGGGCGCGCSETTTTTTTTSPPIISPDETGIVPVYDTTAVVVVDSVKCRSANYLAAKVSYMVRTLGNLGDGGATIAGIITLLVTIITWLTPIPGDEVLATSALIYYAMMIANSLRTADDFAFSIFSDLANELDGNMEAFVCALYGWSSSSDLGNSLSSFINAKIDQIQPSTGMTDSTTNALKNVLNSLIGPAIINWFVEHVASIVPADFTPMYDCTCGAQGDTCPTSRLVIAGVGSLPMTLADLNGMQAFASQFNSKTGYHEIIFELEANYCVTIDNATYTPDEAHEKCSSGVMVASDGSCIRRFVARSLAPFATAVDFVELTTDCNCGSEPVAANVACHDYTAVSPYTVGGGNTASWTLGAGLQITIPMNYNSVPQWGGFWREIVKNWDTRVTSKGVAAVWINANMAATMRITIRSQDLGGIKTNFNERVEPFNGWVRLPLTGDSEMNALSSWDLDIAITDDDHSTLSMLVTNVCVEFAP